MARIEISLNAKEDLESLPTDVRDRIKGKLLGEVADDPERHLRPLSNTEARSIRVGDYRVIADYDRNGDVLRIHQIGHRRNVYDRDFDD